MTSAAPSDLTKIADGVYAFIQEPGGWCVSNCGVIVDRDQLIVVDTAATVSRAKSLKAAIGELVKDCTPVVINTHFHGDHIFGNATLQPVAIYSHVNARDDIISAGLGLTELWPTVEWGDVELRLPTVTYSDRMTLHSGSRSVELLHLGPAHTTGDTLVWLPDDRILFAGDVVMSGCTPFALMGSVTGSLDVLQQIRRLGPETIISGHGSISGPEVINENRNYLEWVLELARKGLASGATPLELTQSTSLPAQFADLLDSERLVANIHRAYADLGGDAPGTPLDVLAIFKEMILANGGVLPSCSA